MERRRQGNIALLEHVNMNTDQPDKMVAFFIDGLGFVQDPRMGNVVDGKVYLNGIVWVNAGLNQIHIPFTSRGASGARINLLRGTIGLLYDSINGLCERLRAVEKGNKMRGTKFAWARTDQHTVEIFCPCGNRFMAHHAPAEARDTRGFHPGPVSFCLGISYVELQCPEGTADAIARYYVNYFGAEAVAEPGLARVATGPSQELLFRETPGMRANVGKTPYEHSDYGLHVAMYLYDQSTAMQRLAQDDLLWGNPRFTVLDKRLGTSQFRCKDIAEVVVALGTRRVLLELEHEVRTLQHGGCPLGRGAPYDLEGRECLVPELVCTVTRDFEADFDAIRAKRMQREAKEGRGFVPVLAPLATAAAAVARL